MSPIGAAIARMAEPLGAFGVDVAALGVLDRSGHLPLGEPGLTSPNGACRLIRAADGWMAVNLARDEDRDLIAAWLEGDWGVEPWAQIERLAPGRTRGELIRRASLLGLPVSAVGEARTAGPPTKRVRYSDGARRDGPLRVLDLSALWAGPMCGAILAAAGAEVIRIESVARPDPTRMTTPRFFERLNGAKAEVALDLTQGADRARLVEMAGSADVLITSARREPLVRLGLTPEGLFERNPGLSWVAITGYGWESPRVAFGDDAAAAGGLLRWTPEGEPRFLGDALADPVTGLAAAAAAFEAVTGGGGALIDVALGHCAAVAAA